MEFIISNYMIFVVIAIVLLLGLFGYMVDKKKYEQYRKEILNQENISVSLESAPEISNVADKVDVNETTLDNGADLTQPISNDGEINK